MAARAWHSIVHTPPCWMLGSSGLCDRPGQACQAKGAQIFCGGCACCWSCIPVYASNMYEIIDTSALQVGDWGRDGHYNQSLVAAAMGQLGAVQKPRFVISVGDNFYESGLTSTEDSQFATSFTNVYSHPSLQARAISCRQSCCTVIDSGLNVTQSLTDMKLQVPFYAVLGNHDYGEVSKARAHLAIRLPFYSVVLGKMLKPCFAALGCGRHAKAHQLQECIGMLLLPLASGASMHRWLPATEYCRSAWGYPQQ